MYLNYVKIWRTRLKMFSRMDSECRPRFNPFPNKPWFLCFYSRYHLKTLWEKEKLLVICNFSFSNLMKMAEVLQTDEKHCGNRRSCSLQAISPKGHCGNRRSCSLRAISPFPKVFSKDLYYSHVKTRACSEKG